MPGSRSNAPSRTPLISPSGVRAKSADPHCTQNALGMPPCGRHSRMCSSPATIRTEPGSTRAVALAAVPVRRWQRVQWQ